MASASAPHLVLLTDIRAPEIGARDLILCAIWACQSIYRSPSVIHHSGCQLRTRRNSALNESPDAFVTRPVSEPTKSRLLRNPACSIACSEISCQACQCDLHLPVGMNHALIIISITTMAWHTGCAIWCSIAADLCCSPNSCRGTFSISQKEYDCPPRAS